MSERLIPPTVDPEASHQLTLQEMTPDMLAQLPLDQQLQVMDRAFMNKSFIPDVAHIDLLQNTLPQVDETTADPALLDLKKNLQPKASWEHWELAEDYAAGLRSFADGNGTAQLPEKIRADTEALLGQMTPSENVVITKLLVSDATKRVALHDAAKLHKDLDGHSQQPTTQAKGEQKQNQDKGRKDYRTGPTAGVRNKRAGKIATSKPERKARTRANNQARNAGLGQYDSTLVDSLPADYASTAASANTAPTPSPAPTPIKAEATARRSTYDATKSPQLNKVSASSLRKLNQGRKLGEKEYEADGEVAYDLALAENSAFDLANKPQPRIRGAFQKIRGLYDLAGAKMTIAGDKRAEVVQSRKKWMAVGVGAVAVANIGLSLYKASKGFDTGSGLANTAEGIPLNTEVPTVLDVPAVPPATEQIPNPAAITLGESGDTIWGEVDEMLAERGIADDDNRLTDEITDRIVAANNYSEYDTTHMAVGQESVVPDISDILPAEQVVAPVEQPAVPPVAEVAAPDQTTVPTENAAANIETRSSEASAEYAASMAASTVTLIGALAAGEYLRSEQLAAAQREKDVAAEEEVADAKKKKAKKVTV